MKKAYKVVSLITITGAPLLAAPFLAIGDNAELFFNARASVAANDNIFLNRFVETEDTVLVFTPGLSLDFGKGSLTTGTFGYTESFTRYMDTDGLDTELSAFVFDANYEDAKFQFDIDASYKQLNQNTIDDVSSALPVLVRRDVTRVAPRVEIEVTEKTSLAGGVSYSNTEYKVPGFAGEITSYAFPLNYYYELTPKMDVGAGFRYTQTDVELGTDQDQYYYSVNARGEFTPKLNGEISVGYKQNDREGGASQESLGLETGLNYKLTPKTTFTLDVIKGYDVSSTGGTRKNFTTRLGASNAIADDWRVSLMTEYRDMDYVGGREDKYFSASPNVTYILNAYFTFSAYYDYRRNSSSAPSASFTNNVFTLAANLRY